MADRIGGGRSLFSRPDARFFWIKLVVVVGFLSGFLLSSKLWVTTRFFPPIPVFPGLPRISYPLDYFYFAVLIALLVMIAIFSNPRIYIFLFVILVLILALLDQTRWQPWAYQYLFMLAALGFSDSKRDDIQSQTDGLNMCRLIVATIYFYSGLQKANPHFIFHEFPEFIAGMGRMATSLHAFGWVAPFAEMGIGIGLLTRKFRDVAVIAAIAMHWLVLLVIGPFGRRWNSVVWPWNLAMIAFLLLLFWKTDFSFSDVIWNNRLRFQKVILLLFGVMPLFSFVGWWDSYLSSSLYSGNVTSGAIFISDAVNDELPSYIRGYVRHVNGTNNVLQITKWSLGELNVPPYPEMRVYREIGADICRLTNNSPDVTLAVQVRSTLLSEGGVTRNTCFGTLVVHGW
jgi:hypothetical protein